MISVIVPIYNVKPYLKRCLDSIQEQTYRDFEVLMIDDGSTDDSAMIAKSYLNDNRFRFFHQSNKGIGAARNVGIDNASGEFLSFIDSDDYIDKKFLDVLYNNLIKFNVDISTCGSVRVWDDGNIIDNTITNRDSGMIDNIHEYLKYASFSVWNKLFSKFLFEGLRFVPGIAFEDFELVPQIIERAKKIYCDERKLYYYTWRRDSITNARRVNFDIYEAFKHLENSNFGRTNQGLIQIYCIREVFGSLVWNMILDPTYHDECKRIVKANVQKYPNLKHYISDSTIGKGKRIWGDLLLQGSFRLAYIYALIFEKVRRVLRRVIRGR